VDGTPGSAFIDLGKVPHGRKVFARECAGCHSSKFAPEAVRADKEALARFYEGHVFGSEQYWQHEFEESERNSKEFKARYLAADARGRLRPKQFATDDVFGQDWLANDEPVPFGVIGTNMCRALHDNHSTGHIWEEFSSETYKRRPPAGSVKNVVSRMVPLVGGKEWGGQREIAGGSGYLRNFSLLSAWATAPFLHNNAIGELTHRPDGSIDYTVRGRVTQFHNAFDELLTPEAQRPVKVARTQHDMKLATQEDGQGLIKLPVAKGTPIGWFTSANPHRPLYMKCDDHVENKGHAFGVDLPAADKAALAEFLKLM
jgi:hypothetical protein